MGRTAIDGLLVLKKLSLSLVCGHIISLVTVGLKVQVIVPSVGHLFKLSDVIPFFFLPISYALFELKRLPPVKIQKPSKSGRLP